MNDCIKCGGKGYYWSRNPTKTKVTEICQTCRGYGQVDTVTQSCDCGSGLAKRELNDAAGVFCCFVCDDCEDKKRSVFNPRIFEEPYDANEQEPIWPEKENN